MLLQLEDVTKSFGAVLALNHLSFDVAEGETLGIMGPNGAGKTTLLNLIMGAIPLDAGSIRFSGERITGRLGITGKLGATSSLGASTICRRGIGRTYQIPQPFKQMTVLENLLVGELYGSHRQSMKASKAHAREVLERVGLLEKTHTPASMLGLLDLKRLELARTLALTPRLLLLDKIAGGLVEGEVEELKRILFDLKRSGLSLLIIEHVLSVLFDLSDRIVVMDFGGIIAEGSPADVIHNPYVIEAYLGAQQTNELTFSPRDSEKNRELSRSREVFVMTGNCPYFPLAQRTCQ